MLKTIRYVVGDNDIVSSAAAAVRHRCCDVHWIVRANLFRSAHVACENWVSAKQRTESYRCGFRTEASAKFSFTFTFQPYFCWAAFPFLHVADVPSDFRTFDFCFRLAANKSDSLGKTCCHFDIANAIASFDIKLERILITEHAHAWVSSSYNDAITAAKFIARRIVASHLRFANRLANRWTCRFADRRRTYRLAWRWARWRAWRWACWFANRCAWWWANRFAHWRTHRFTMWRAYRLATWCTCGFTWFAWRRACWLAHRFACRLTRIATVVFSSAASPENG